MNPEGLKLRLSPQSKNLRKVSVFTTYRKKTLIVETTRVTLVPCDMTIKCRKYNLKLLEGSNSHPITKKNPQLERRGGIKPYPMKNPYDQIKATTKNNVKAYSILRRKCLHQFVNLSLTSDSG